MSSSDGKQKCPEGKCVNATQDGKCPCPKCLNCPNDCCSCCKLGARAEKCDQCHHDKGCHGCDKGCCHCCKQCQEKCPPGEKCQPCAACGSCKNKEKCAQSGGKPQAAKA